MGHAMIAGGKPDMAAPVTGILLSSIAEGSIVKLNESGSPVEFYVAKHNYESGLNGAGRTLLVRKYCYNACKWSESNGNAYASSNIDSCLNVDYKALLDFDIQSVIGTTKFYYTPGNGNTNVTTLERSIFLLSVTELGKTASYAKAEGGSLPIASTLQIAHNESGSTAVQWTRSPVTNGTASAYCLLSGGTVADIGCGNANWSRPVFTLPGTAKFDETTLILKGAA